MRRSLPFRLYCIFCKLHYRITTAAVRSFNTESTSFEFRPQRNRRRTTNAVAAPPNTERYGYDSEWNTHACWSLVVDVPRGTYNVCGRSVYLHQPAQWKRWSRSSTDCKTSSTPSVTMPYSSRKSSLSDHRLVSVPVQPFITVVPLALFHSAVLSIPCVGHHRRTITIYHYCDWLIIAYLSVLVLIGSIPLAIMFSSDCK